MQVGCGAIRQANEFKALQALTEQLNAAQQRAEENGKTEAAAARAAIQALAESVSKRLGGGELVGQTFSKHGLHVPCSAAAGKNKMLLEFNTSGQNTTCDELDASALLAACTAWLPPAACSDIEGALQPVAEQEGQYLIVDRFSTWLPAADTFAVAGAEGNRHLDVAALLASTSSWLLPTSYDYPATQVDCARVSTWLSPELAAANSAMLKAGDGFSSWLPPPALIAAAAGTGEGGHMDASDLLASVSSWLPPASNETVPCVEVRLADALDRMVLTMILPHRMSTREFRPGCLLRPPLSLLL
jgi:hypothetical protein